MNRAWRGIVMGLVLCISVAAFAPIYPELPSDKVDPSWMLALNQAMAQGLVFGRDVVFTFGPYSALFTQAYHPANFSIILCLGVLFGISYTVLLLMATRSIRLHWLLTYAVFLLFIDSRDTLFFSYPLLVALVAYRATLPTTDDRRITLGTGLRFGYGIAIALLGVLPITKVSFLPLVLVAVLIGFILFWVEGSKRLAVLFLLLPPLTMVAAWRFAGQPISALPNYFYTVAPMVAGYNEAMSMYPSNSTWRLLKATALGMIAAYLALTVSTLAAVWRNMRDSRVRTTVMMLCIALFLFLGFKAGLVRQDSAHIVAASSALVLTILALNTFELASVSLWATLFTFALWAAIHAIHTDASLAGTPLFSLTSVAMQSRKESNLQTAFIEQLQSIHDMHTVMPLNGSTDIYPLDQAALIASGNQWSPRPIIQSYAAYAPSLAKLNDDHLRGPYAPQNIVFNVTPFDHRFPSLEDGLSWPTLLSHYSIANQDKNYIYFKRRVTARSLDPTLLTRGMGTMRNEVVDIPPQPDTVFAQIDVEPSALGRVANILFKTSPLYISVETEDGHSQSFRFIAGMARNGFILSPLVQTNAEFVQLASEPTGFAKKNRVKRFAITPADGWSFLWRDQYNFKLFALKTEFTPLSQTATTYPMPGAHDTFGRSTTLYAK